jgi:hypothetical protein
MPNANDFYDAIKTIVKNTIPTQEQGVYVVDGSNSIVLTGKGTKDVPLGVQLSNSIPLIVGTGVDGPNEGGTYTIESPPELMGSSSVDVVDHVVSLSATAISSLSSPDYIPVVVQQQPDTTYKLGVDRSSFEGGEMYRTVVWSDGVTIASTPHGSSWSEVEAIVQTMSPTVANPVTILIFPGSHDAVTIHDDGLSFVGVDRDTCLVVGIDNSEGHNGISMRNVKIISSSNTAVINQGTMSILGTDLSVVSGATSSDLYGILNNGTLSLSQSTVTLPGKYDSGANTAAIANNGTLTMMDSTVSTQRVDSNGIGLPCIDTRYNMKLDRCTITGATGSGDNAGGVGILISGNVVCDNSTVNGGQGGRLSEGGSAIYVDLTGVLEATNSTFLGGNGGNGGLVAFSVVPSPAGNGGRGVDNHGQATLSSCKVRGGNGGTAMSSDTILGGGDGGDGGAGITNNGQLSVSNSSVYGGYGTNGGYGTDAPASAGGKGGNGGEGIYNTSNITVRTTVVSSGRGGDGGYGRDGNSDTSSVGADGGVGGNGGSAVANGGSVIVENSTLNAGGGGDGGKGGNMVDITSNVNAGNGGLGGNGGNSITSSIYFSARNCTMVAGTGGRGGNGGNATTSSSVSGNGGSGGRGGNGGNGIANTSTGLTNELDITGSDGGSGGAGGTSTSGVPAPSGLNGVAGYGVDNTGKLTCKDSTITSSSYGVYNSNSTTTIYDHCTMVSTYDDTTQIATIYKYCTNQSTLYAYVGTAPVQSYNYS